MMSPVARFQVLLYEPNPQADQEFVNIPSYVTFHSQQGETEAVSHTPRKGLLATIW